MSVVSFALAVVFIIRLFSTSAFRVPKFGEIRQKSFAPHTFACSYTYDEKASPPRCHSFEGAEGKWPRHASILQCPYAYYSTRTLFTRCCRLQCATAMKINCQRSPKTEQFMTAKISGNASKQGVKHTQCSVSAGHNCKNARLRECLVV